MDGKWGKWYVVPLLLVALAIDVVQDTIARIKRWWAR